MELLTKLGIDWKLLIAQFVNFIILFLVLYKFVYRPVLEMMERRTKTIEKGVHDAKEAEEKLAHITKLQDQRMSETEKQVGVLLQQAKKDAEVVKKDLLAAAQAQSEDLLRRAKIQITEEKEKMLEEVKNEVSAFIVKASQKIIEREFNPADQKRLIDAVTKEMAS